MHRIQYTKLTPDQIAGKLATATRRSFIQAAGAALSGPLAAAANAPAGAVDNDDALKARLAMIDDVNAIRALNLAYARRLNAGAHEEIAALRTYQTHHREYRWSPIL